MVKADAYNHGMFLCSEIESSVTGFGVSTSKEGRYLRKIGITKPIKVVAFESSQLKDAAAFDLTPVVSDISTLKKIISLKTEMQIAFKVDCGMNRMGINNLYDLYEGLCLLSSNDFIKVKTIVTHFSFSDYENMKQQCQKFLKYCQIIEEKIGRVNKSAGASSAICYGKEFLFDEVRAGLALYGYMPDSAMDLGLEKAMSVTVPIIEVKEVAKSQKIGYAGLYTADKNVRIGIIRGGYYDGINRLASGCRVIVNGKESRLVGSVCMDLSFVLLDDIQAKKGDNVILISQDNDAYELAKHCKTIPYEILTSFKGRIKRLYYF